MTLFYREWKGKSMWNPNPEIRIRQIMMLTTEEPAESSGYLYYYENELPAVARNYANVRIEPFDEGKFPPQTTLVIASDTETALAYRTKGYAVILQKELSDLVTDSSLYEELPYVMDYPCDFPDDYFEKVFCRMQGLPLAIAKTERLLLREITTEDLPQLYDVYDDEESRRFMEQLYTYEEELAYQKDYIKHQYGFYDYGLWVVIERESGRLIGRVGISNRVIDGVERQELGYIIHRDYRRKGYAYEACRAVLEFASDTRMEGLVIVTESDNLPSRELAVKLGFTYTDQIGCEYMLFQHKG